MVAFNAVVERVQTGTASIRVYGLKNKYIKVDQKLLNTEVESGDWIVVDIEVE